MTIGPLFPSFIVIGVNRWRRRARRLQFPMTDNAPSETTNSTRSGKTERVSVKNGMESHQRPLVFLRVAA